MTVEPIPVYTSAKQYSVYTSLVLLGYTPVLEKAVLDHSGQKRLIDIAIEDLKVAIEYDGIRWHATEESLAADRSKSIALLESGWRVIRMRECSPRTYLPPLGIDNWSYGEMTCTSLSDGKFFDRDIELLAALIKRVTATPRESSMPTKSKQTECNGDRGTPMEIKSGDDLRKALTKVRIASGLTQKELSNEVGVNRTYLSRMESGDISLVFVDRLLDMLEICGATVTVSLNDEK